MKLKFRHNVIPAVVCVLLGCTGEAFVGELGHYSPSFLNVSDFFVLPDPGIYYVQYNYQYNTDTLKNRNGDEVKLLTVRIPRVYMPGKL
jgi:hypothetical protein